MKNFRKTFQSRFGGKPGRFGDTVKIWKVQTFTHFLEFLKTCLKTFRFFLENDRHMSADSEKPKLCRIGMKYCNVAKTMGRDGRICVEMNGCARVVAVCGRSISVAIFLNHDAQIAAQATLF